MGIPNQPVAKWVPDRHPSQSVGRVWVELPIVKLCIRQYKHGLGIVCELIMEHHKQGFLDGQHLRRADLPWNIPFCITEDRLIELHIPHFSPHAHFFPCKNEEYLGAATCCPWWEKGNGSCYLACKESSRKGSPSIPPISSCPTIHNQGWENLSIFGRQLLCKRNQCPVVPKLVCMVNVNTPTKVLEIPLG